MFKNVLKSDITLIALLLIGICFSLPSAHAADAHPDIEALTNSGEKVILHADGKWEFVNAQKAAAAKEIAIKLDPAANCPAGSQGTFFGFGRCILPGDKDYQTGSRSGKGFGQ